MFFTVNCHANCLYTLYTRWILWCCVLFLVYLQQNKQFSCFKLFTEHVLLTALECSFFDSLKLFYKKIKFPISNAWHLVEYYCIYHELVFLFMHIHSLNKTIKQKIKFQNCNSKPGQQSFAEPWFDEFIVDGFGNVLCICEQRLNVICPIDGHSVEGADFADVTFAQWTWPLVQVVCQHWNITFTIIWLEHNKWKAGKL